MRRRYLAGKSFEFALLAIVVTAVVRGGAIPSGAAADAAGGVGAFLGEGIDFKGGMLDWEEDDSGRRVAILRNYAVVILPQVTISARNMVLNVEMQEIYAEGDVLFDEANGNAFYADQLTFNYQEWKGLAKNIRVKMDRAGVEIPVQDFLDQEPSIDMTSASSLNDAGEIAGNLKRMYVQAQELRAHDSQTFELIDAKITPSAFAKPHWYFRSPAALLRQKEKIESYHNTVNVGSVPVLYFPYLIRDLQYDWPWMRITGGSTSDFGVFLKTQWGWQLNQREDAFFRMRKLIFDLDYYTRRGVGVGFETTYKLGDWDSLGKLKLYGVYEHAISRARDWRRAHEDNADKIFQNHPDFRPSLYRKDFRWAVDWEHYSQLNDFWDIRAEAHLYHDRDYLREYDSARYWSGKEPENAVNLRRLDRQWVLEFVAKSRLSNKWETSSEYYPEMRLTVPGWQLFDLPLYVKNDMRVGVIDRRFDEDEYFYTRDNADGLFALDPRTGLSESRLLDRDRYGSMFRAVNELRIEAPIKMGILTLKPWIGLRAAYYSDTIGEPYGADHWNSFPVNSTNPNYIAWREGRFTAGQMRNRNGGDEIDFAVPYGAELSTRAYTIFGAHDQWRLITEPVVSYLENPAARLDYEREVFPVDSFDEYRRQRRFGFELHNKLQRRYYEDAPGDVIPERDILDFNVAFYNFPRRADRDRVNYRQEFSEISSELIYRPTSRLELTASVDYDPHENSFNRAILGADWRLGNLFRIRARHFHYSGNNPRYDAAETSSQTHLAIRAKLWNDSSRYSIEGAVSYEWRRGDDEVYWRTDRDGVRHGFNKYRITLFRDLDTFELAISYVRDRNASDHGVFFTLAPKSFMGFDRPPPSYTVEVETLADGRYPDSVRYLGSGYRIDGPVADADLKDVQF